ncbi:MAG TPA: prepilin-type N-terminal cleavage/methylation domain-containing protein [Geobacteraceae bacterium]
MGTTTGTQYAARSTQRGFTLLELVVVIVILALTAAIVLPRFSFTDDGRLRTSARTVAALLRYLGERGATGGGTYRLHLNPGDNTMSVTRLAENGEESRPEDPFLNRAFLAQGVSLADVVLPRFGKVRESEVIVTLGPRGLSDFLVLHLKGKGEAAYTIFAYPEGGRVKVVAGYQEEDA